jgi:hypothetical protein
MFEEGGDVSMKVGTKKLGPVHVTLVFEEGKDVSMKVEQ